jgi:hypothetical protein
MQGRDRLANLALFGLAALAWAVVALFLANRSPIGDVAAQLIGGALLGLAAGLTAAPFFWLAGFGRQRRIAYRGDWLRAARRALWVGLVAAIFVVLRAQGAFSLALAAFVLVLVAFVELTLSVER